MKRTGLKVLVIGLTALGLSAGVVAGMLVSRLPAAMSGAGSQPMPMRAMPTSLVEGLNLTPTQQDQMRVIWEHVREQVQGCFSDAQNLQKSRDDEIIGLLNNDQKAKFEEISKRYHASDVKIKADRERFLSEAVNATKQLLNDEQKKKYDEILKQRLGKVPTTGPVAAAFGFVDPNCVGLNNFGDAWTQGAAHD